MTKQTATRLLSTSVLVVLAGCAIPQQQPGTVTETSTTLMENTLEQDPTGPNRNLFPRRGRM
jgi:hypothetical protein